MNGTREPRHLPEWLQRYLHCPWVEAGRDDAGADCWGYLRLLMREQGVELPTAPGKSAAALRAAVSIQRSWPEVPIGRERFGDVVLFRHDVHVGMVVAAGWMTHLERGLTPVVESFLKPWWRPRVEAIYRHT